MSRRLSFALCLLSLGFSIAARANVIWRGDFETGDLSQWSKAQLTATDRAAVVTSPVYQGRYALKVTVKQGDNPIGASGNRNELLYLSYEPQGTERWYRWQTLWDPSYPSVATWQLFTQWHHSGDSGSPPMEFYVYAEEIRLRIDASTIIWTHPLVRGVWHDFVLHVRWSPDASEGFVELWFDGQQALPKKSAATQFPGMTNYLKVGLYRDDTISQTGIVYHDGWTIGETREDVWPSEIGSAADAGIPQPKADAGNPPQPATDAGASRLPTVDAGAPAVADAASPGIPPDSGAAPLSPDETVGCSGAPGALLLPFGALALVGSRFRRREEP